MPDLEINIFNKKIKLSYQENEKQRLLNAVEKLNYKWKNFSNLQGKVSDLKIATLISLELQDSLADLNVLSDDLKIKEANNEILKKEIVLKKKETKEINETIKKLEKELAIKINELTDLEIVLDEFNVELLQIKKNLKND